MEGKSRRVIFMVEKVRYKSINIAEKLSMFSEKWSPKIIAELNDYQFKLAKIKGEFVWHSHSDTDEAFIVIKGQLCIHFRDGKVDLSEGELFVVPKGKEHKPEAKEESHILLVEPKGLINTGEQTSTLTAKNDVWI